MALTAAQYTEIMDGYNRRRLGAERDQQERYREVCERVPKIGEIDREILSVFSGQARDAARGKRTDREAALFTVRKLTEEKKALLTSAGYGPDYLEVRYSCPLCMDTGYVDGQKCSCFEKEVTKLLYRDSPVRKLFDEETFDTFELSYYSENHIDQESGLSARDYAVKALAACREFVGDFPEKKGSLFLYGNVGTGKSFLTHAIAKELIGQGFSVLYLTAFEFVDALAGARFRRDAAFAETAEMIYACDLLIIDDLGTELTNTFVASELFSCINERLLKEKGTIISTNLSLEAVAEIYSERTFSRIVSNYRLIRLTGDDIRLQKRLKA